ncbi:hypothetical protein C7H19_10825 [Aphanothece hegewaldii CCALA 016]|uniref:DUF1802 domain-containing protein n=1 Tax=Aphanothece hegewaldii CCALA 016 TaxID=2107694 RepID=A0A2T1LXV2_9CHRO|nr:DUF1802 family protein [Aphanothece hegewaldii]PSF37206.1 hypothetical protein C7H19_10825 [Aphanothece hegewaldii CCALA 016]
MQSTITRLTHALKEWDTAITALEKGETILLLRKGGIKEEKGKFSIKYEQVLLYPTYEHQKPELLKPEYAANVTPVASGWHPDTIKISSWAQITDILTVTEENIVNQLLPYHIWNEKLVSDRLNWKPKQPLHLLLLRVYLLPEALHIPYDPTYGGCQSWINLLEPISLESSTAVLKNEEYQERVKDIALQCTH